MKPLTREEELGQIEALLAMRQPEARLHLQRRYDAMPEQWKLSRETAEFEALCNVRGQVSKKEKLTLPEDVANDDVRQEIAFLLTAGLMRCLQNACQHAFTLSPPLMHAFLAPRVVSCEQCMPQFKPVCLKHDSSREHAGECDLCLVQNVSAFRAFRCAFNGAILYGDMCGACAAKMGYA